MSQKIKIYGADIYNDINPRIELGARLLGIEDYVGICKKNNWDNPILVTIKDNKIVARPIIIDKELDSYYCYSTEIDISSILSDEDIEYLNRIVNQSINADVPLIELSDKLEIDENILFNHAIQSIDKNAFRDFSQAKKKDDSIDITAFVKKAHENSDIKKVNEDIEKVISNRKQAVNLSTGFNVFAIIKPVSLSEIKQIYSNNGFYNVNESQILNIAKEINGNLKTYLIEVFKKRIITAILKTRIEKKDFKYYISESVIKNYIHSVQINFTDEIEANIVTDILNECNDNNKIKNLYVAKNLTNQFESDLGKKLDVSYTLAISERLDEVKKAQKENKPIPDRLLTESDVKTYSDNPDNISSEDVQYVANELNDSIGSIVELDIKWDIIFDLTNKYNNGIPFTPVTANDLKSKYSFNDKDAQRLAIEINEMLEGYIGYTQESEKLTKPEEEIIQSSKHR